MNTTTASPSFAVPTGAPAAARQVLRLLQRLVHSGRDEDRLEVAVADAHLAEYAFHRKDLKTAVLHLEAGLQQVDVFGERTGTPIQDAGLALLRAYAELHLYGGLPLSGLTLDLPGRLQQTYATLCKRPNPQWLEARDRFALYLVLLHLEGIPAGKGS